MKKEAVITKYSLQLFMQDINVDSIDKIMTVPAIKNHCIEVIGDEQYIGFATIPTDFILYTNKTAYYKLMKNVETLTDFLNTPWYRVHTIYK